MEPKKIVGNPATEACDAGQDRQPAASERISVQCYEREVPSFVGPEMERLYGNIYSSLVQFRIYGGAVADTSTYVVREGGVPITIFLFRREKRRAHVFNEGICIGSDDIDRFARHVFDSYASVDVVTFHAIEYRHRRLSHCYQRFHCTEDLVVALPATAEEYRNLLGKNTRRNIKRYMERLRRSFPSFRYEMRAGREVGACHMRKIIDLHRARIAGKNKVSTIDEAEEERIVRLACACGLVGMATIEGQVRGGAIAYHCGANYFLYVIAHDPAYDDYWLGMLCCYLTICECIARGGKEFHFLWGRYEYKFLLGAGLRHLDRLAVYRSPARLFLNAGLALRIVADGCLHDLKFGLLEKARRREDPAGRMLSAALKMLRRCRRLLAWRPATF